MNKEIEMLYKTLDVKDKIINEQALEIAKLKEEKRQVINLVKRSAGYKGICTQPETDTFSTILEILGDKENE